jgi:hypothetical protein
MPRIGARCELSWCEPIEVRVRSVGIRARESQQKGIDGSGAARFFKTAIFLFMARHTSSKTIFLARCQQKNTAVVDGE